MSDWYLQSVRARMTVRCPCHLLIDDICWEDVPPIILPGLSAKRKLHVNFGWLKANLLEHLVCVEELGTSTLNAVVDVIGTKLVRIDWVRGCHTTTIWGAFNESDSEFFRVPREGFSAGHARGTSAENDDVLPLECRSVLAWMHDVVPLGGCGRE